MANDSLIVLLMLAVALMAAGCSQQNNRTPDDIRNSPRTPAEGRLLMEEMEQQEAEYEWPPEVSRHMRQALKGRLLASGLPRSEFETWIAANSRQADNERNAREDKDTK